MLWVGLGSGHLLVVNAATQAPLVVTRRHTDTIRGIIFVKALSKTLFEVDSLTLHTVGDPPWSSAHQWDEVDSLTPCIQWGIPLGRVHTSGMRLIH